jgi:hypothetical protein
VKRWATLLFLVIWIPMMPISSTEAEVPAKQRPIACARDGYSKIDEVVVEHFRCPNGTRIIVPRPELKEIPRPFVPSWRKWPDEVNV